MNPALLAAIISASSNSRRHELSCPCGSRDISGAWRPVDEEHEAFNYRCAACGAVHGELAALVRVA